MFIKITAEIMISIFAIVALCYEEKLAAWERRMVIKFKKKKSQKRIAKMICANAFIN